MEKSQTYTLVNGRIIVVRFRINGGSLSVIGVYAPESGKLEQSDLFYDELKKQLHVYNITDHVVIVGDLNARPGNQTIENVMFFFGMSSIKRKV